MQDLESKKVENQDQPPEDFRDDNSVQNEGGDLEEVSTDEEEREESLQAGQEDKKIMTDALEKVIR